jgi:hypothetical protein
MSVATTIQTLHDENARLPGQALLMPIGTSAETTLSRLHVNKSK